jgi:phosphoadenosine phosphosulfate reductase
LVRFIRRNYPEVIFNFPRTKDGKRLTLVRLLEQTGFPPTRIMRYCCRYFKESYGEGEFVITGIRRAESVKRSKRGGLELAKRKSHYMDNYDPDNPSQNLIDTCPTMARRMLNPIIDWSDSEVWEFIRNENIPYCGLYDEGFKRLGCIGCPMTSLDKRKRDFERWPGYERLWLLGFERMLRGRETTWKTAEDVMDWWLGENRRKKTAKKALML